MAMCVTALSYTAPHWENKQNESEKASITEEEKKAIEKDISFGQRVRYLTRNANDGCTGICPDAGCNWLDP
jgi:hypothetical protein